MVFGPLDRRGWARVGHVLCLLRIVEGRCRWMRWMRCVRMEVRPGDVKRGSPWRVGLQVMRGCFHEMRSASCLRVVGFQCRDARLLL